MEHQLPELPYSLDALEPHISEETLRFHHGKHHAAYVKNLNKLIQNTEFAEQSLEDIIRNADGGIFNNAAQVWNHTVYWHSLSPQGGGQPEGQLAELLDQTFASFEGFQKKFNEAATKLFGSGWVWLTRNEQGELEIESTQNADTPLCRNKTVLLACDVWEHAYYIDHRNARADYMSAFWQLVNWQYAAQQCTITPAPIRQST